MVIEFDCATQGDIGTNTVTYHYKFGDKLGRRYAEWAVSDDVRVKVSRDGHLPLVVAFQGECGIISDRLLQAYPEFKDVLDEVNARLPEGARAKREIAALSHLMATLEDGLLMALEKFLHTEGYDVDSLEFDGLKPRRPDGNTAAFPVGVLRKAEVYLAAQELRGGVKIPMKLAEKPLESMFM